MRFYQYADKYVGKILGIIILLGLWSWGSMHYSDLILPSPLQTLQRLYEIFSVENGMAQLGITIVRALTGFVLSVLGAMTCGIIAGIVPILRSMFHPLERIMISVPPIAWVVLTILWFGGTGIGSAVLTIFIASFPVIYISTVQGVKTLDARLLDMGCSFGMSHTKTVLRIGFIHVLSMTFPAIRVVFGQSWKVGVMAEVLGATNGIGAQISTARAHLETPDVFAWVAVAVILFIVTDELFISPIHTYTMKWR